jgi:hypothetical protein
MTRPALALSEAVAARVAAEVLRRAERLEADGGAVADMGSPDELADRLLAALPGPGPWRELGPCYSSKGVGIALGGVSRQAVEERRRRRTILALRTADGVWVYPAFQLDARNQVLRGLPAVLQALEGSLDDWTIASLLLRPQPLLDGRSFIEALRAGDAAAVVAVATAAGERLGAAAG